jgi:hypothetical protein
MVRLLCPVYIFVFDKLNAPSVDYIKLATMKANCHKDRPAGMSLEPKRHLHASISLATQGDDPVKDLAGESYFKAFLSSAMLIKRFTTADSTPAGRNASITTRIRHEYARH